jgi:ABC-type Fe3+ transport system substrate-binding protein
VKKLLIVVLAWLAAPGTAAATAGQTLVVLTSFPKEMFEPYTAAFTAHDGGTEVIVKSKTTSACVAYLQETRRQPDVDIMWASANDAFAVLAKDQLLTSFRLPAEVAQRIPATVGPYPVHDPGGRYFGFALSGYGIMWNIPYLQAYRLPRPTDWADLADPRYAGHLSMCAPSRSGTTHLLVEAILQEYGWEKGWRLLLEIGGNLSTLTERSFGVPQGVGSGEFGLGLVIDFMALSAKAARQPVDFVYPPTSPIVPAGVAIVSGAPHAEVAARFVTFLLSDKGQRLLLDPSISRLPVVPALYAQAPPGYPNPFTLAPSRCRFDPAVSEARYELVNALFDQVVTFRLAELKQAWQAIHQTAAAAAAAPASLAGRAALAALDSARTLAGSVPVSAAQAADAAFVARLAGGETRAAQEAVWDAASQAAYARARALAEQAQAALP